MRSLVVFVIASSFIGAGCSHGDKKHDQEMTTTVPSKAIESTKKGVEHTTMAAVAAADSKGAAKSQCSVKGDERVIEVRAKDKGCELAYTKGGTESVIASASHGSAYCEKAADKLKEKLKGSGYTCK